MAYLLLDSKLFKGRNFILFIPCPFESDLQGAVDTSLLNEISFTSYGKYLKRSALYIHPMGNYSLPPRNCELHFR